MRTLYGELNEWVLFQLDRFTRLVENKETAEIVKQVSACMIQVGHACFDLGVLAAACTYLLCIG